MINKKTLSTATLPTVLGIALTIGLPVLGHEGRNFEVQIVDDQLRLQGVNTLTESAPENEPGISPQGRTYFGAVHDHFEYITIDETTVRGIAEQPGFLVSQSLTQLAGEQLTLTVVGAVKWEVDRDSTIDPITGQLLEGFDINTIDFVDLDADETISVLSTRVEDQSATTDGGSFLLAQNILGDNANLDEVDGFDDIEVFYEIGVERPDSIFVIESVLQTSAEGVADSESFFTILSPDGQGFAQVLHFPSLQAEQFFGTPVPEPGSITLVALLPVLMRRRRRG